MTGLERIPALLIGATLTLAGLMLLLIVLWLFALVVRRIEESNAVREQQHARHSMGSDPDF